MELINCVWIATIVYLALLAFTVFVACGLGIEIRKIKQIGWEHDGGRTLCFLLAVLALLGALTYRLGLVYYNTALIIRVIYIFSVLASIPFGFFSEKIFANSSNSKTKGDNKTA